MDLFSLGKNRSCFFCFIFFLCHYVWRLTVQTNQSENYTFSNKYCKEKMYDMRATAFRNSLISYEKSLAHLWHTHCYLRRRQNNPIYCSWENQVAETTALSKKKKANAYKCKCIQHAEWNRVNETLSHANSGSTWYWLLIILTLIVKGHTLYYYCFNILEW